MAATELTEEQRRAIEVEGPAAVRAGAGSGKTTVLAHRFLHLLRPGGDGRPPVQHVNEILAITFTEKAAGEMKRQIRELLAAEIAHATGAELPRWQSVRRELLGAQISTVHAFCARVVRENPLEGGVDPRATIVEEHESRAYLEAVIEAELVGRLGHGDRAARELVLRCRGLRGGRGGGAVALVAGFLGWLGTTGRDAAWLAEALRRQEACVPAAVGAMRAAAERIAATVRAGLAEGGSARGLGALRAAWPAWEERLARLGPETPPEAFGELDRLWRLLKEARLARHVADDLAVDDGRLTGTLADEYGFLRALPASRALAGLVGEIADVVRTRKRADAVLTFDDLVTEARALFAAHPPVLARYARRFRAILVDEFQDTDAVQADLIQRLAAGPPAATLFIVGDEKQSIYRFRGADIAVFQRVRAGVGHELPLGTNFRSQPAILEFVNALAARVLQVPADAVRPADHWTVFDPTQRLVPTREQEWPRPGVELVTFVGAHRQRRLGAAEARELEARVLAGVIAALRERAGPAIRHGDIAVLFRTLNQVKAYEYALRRREIPYYVVKGRGFFQCQEVSDVVSMLAAVADPRDGVALAAVLRSPFFAVDDDTLWRLAWPAGAARPQLTRRFRLGATFEDLPARAAELRRIRDLLLRLRRMRSRATITELLEEALAATDFEAVCLTQFQGTQKVANVRKVIELARDFERRRLFTLHDFVRTVRDLAAREPREPEAPLVGEQDDVVRLMTIHQAKGLEFPVVILVDLGRRLEYDNGTTVLDEEYGLVAAPTEGAGFRALRQARLEAYRRRERDRTRAEHARLLYVACTRARNRLVLLEGKGTASYLEQGTGDAYPWCHQIWDVVGRPSLAEFVRGGAPRTTVPLPGGGEVLVTRAEVYLERGGIEAAPLPEPREAAATDVERALVARVRGFEPPVPAEMAVSPTALADFRRCPRQYWYRHLLGLPEPGTGGTRARLLGTAAHGVLEALDPLTASPADIERHLAARSEALALSASALDALAGDLRQAAEMLGREAVAGLEIVGREVPFVLPLPARRPRVFLQGRIDLLARRAGTALVRDYKYARPSAESAAQHAAQLGAYRLAVGASGEERVEAELVFLRGGTTLWPLPAIDPAAEEETLVRAADDLGAALVRGDAAAFPRRPPGPAACAALGCGYVRRCWGAPAGAALTRTAPDLPNCNGAA